MEEYRLRSIVDDESSITFGTTISAERPEGAGLCFAEDAFHVEQMLEDDEDEDMSKGSDEDDDDDGEDWIEVC
eukprot:CAMPEP_0196801342 /NCGR_PEP_ID=MMETSP1362-20130617/1091_1 /TAXON_ID=163516 /ORGANISM="Leptocylindrus danicus, Strain CCMP1856" /LENGTH=72 /DNA_ID=CAMNT_0042172245 /DNA_START=162 /DNA_END=377 /DNA_ORIENTATION=-